LQYVAVCCSVLQYVAVCCSVLQCVAVCCSVLQCVAVCCNVMQCLRHNKDTIAHSLLQMHPTKESIFCKRDLSSEGAYQSYPQQRHNGTFSFAKEPCKREYILQKRPVISMRLPIVPTVKAQRRITSNWGGYA